MSATSKRNRALQDGREPVTGKNVKLEADMAIDMAAAPDDNANEDPKDDSPAETDDTE